MKKITVVGSGYVGMSLSALLSSKHEVQVLDIDENKVKKINQKKTTVADVDIEKALKDKNLSLCATLDKKEAYKDADFIIVCTPTDFDSNANRFITSVVDKVISDAIEQNDKALIVIKSTLPIGHTQYLQKKFKTKRIIFSPEFLREGKALFDNLNPTRIVIGGDCESSINFAEILEDCSNKSNVLKLFMNASEAEAVKLFSNSYLAMRVSFFNELDNFAILNKLDSNKIIEGISADSRIGNHYNNPSFGYGGYCLPKDTKQLLSDFDQIPQRLISAIVESNNVRKDFISEQIRALKPKVVGIYRLSMKSGSDNFRDSAVKDIIENLSDEFDLIIYEPLISDSYFGSFKVLNDINNFKNDSDIIIANRISERLNDVREKVFTRDIFQNN